MVTTKNQLLSIKTMNSGIRFILQVGLKDSSIIDYQIEMINQNAKDSLIQIEKAIVGDSSQLHYDITGLQSLGEYLSKNTLNKKLLIGILDNICDTLLQWDSYFLNKNNYLIDMSYIFIDIKTGKIKMIYVPIEEQLDVDIDKSFKTLLKETIVDYAILEDTALDDYLYKILNATKAVDFSIESFRKRAQEILNEKPEPKNVETQNTKQPVQQKASENNKPVDVKPQVEENQNFKVTYKTSIKVIAGVLQGVVGLMILGMLFIAPNFLNLDPVVAVVITFVIILIDIGVMLVLFSKNNQVKEPVTNVKVNNYKNANSQHRVQDSTPQDDFNNVNAPSVNLAKREIVTQLSYDTEVLESSVPYLLLSQGGTVDKIFINKDIFKLGRLEEVNDYVVQAKPVGKEHAVIIKKGLDYSIKDLDSKNGTFVNGKKLIAGEEILLRDGDEVVLANIIFKFKVM